MADGLVQILDGNTFVVSSANGDIEASLTDPTGLFSFDTRFLSKWVLTVNGQRLNPLSVDDLQYFETRFFLVPGTGTVYIDAKLSVIRQRAVGNGFHEELTILNHDEKPVTLTVRVEAGCDFADLFEVKDALAKKGTYSARVESGSLRLGYRREKFTRETLISASAPARVDKTGLTFKVRIEPHKSWTTDLDVVTAAGAGGTYVRPKYARGAQRARPSMALSLEKWIADAPRLQCDSDELRATYRRSLVDLAALRFSPPVAGGRSLPAAGLPWFMTMFGRDSIFTSLQALPFTPELAATTLRALGDWQGSRIDDFRDEDPGRILHEMRYGEMTAFEERPHSPYYGCADATPLYVVLLDEYERWTGDRKLVRELESEARAALNWIDEYADLLGTGYIWYQRRNEKTGLENQCWKDSWDSISYRDGRLPGFPRATCELQGYAYDAKVRGARLARLVWKDPALADRLEREAADLKRRFNRDFWVSDGGYFALALDTEGKQVDVLASNNGHLLWSGIVDKAKAKSVAEHLLGPRLFSGWGVRTLAEGEGRYNPIGYHVGTVWPFDNSFIAWGLRRYGFKDEAAQIAAGILDAAVMFDGRLPEAFGGYARGVTKYPVQYPTACSPQAWSTGTPLLLLRTMLGLEPLGDHLVVDPALPRGIGRIELLDIPGRWGRIDAFGRGRVDTEKGAKDMSERPRVLVLGGGFAGIGATKKLDDADVDVVVVDKHDYHTFQPLLYQLATGLLETTAVGHSLRDLVKSQDNATIHMAPITEIDLDAKAVQFDGLAPIAYDYLVLALGAQVNFFGTDGAAEHAFPMYTLLDAVRLKNHVLGRWEAADKDDALVDDGALTVVVVGGGPTGVETAGALAELYRNNFDKDYPQLPQEKARIVLVEAGDEIFAMFKPNLREYANDALEKRTVEVMTGARVKSVSPTRVTLSTGEVISAHTLVWGAGLQGNSLVQSLGIELQRGNRIAVGPDLELPGYPGVFVVGDVAAIPDSKTDEVLPQLGSVALQSGEHVGETISRRAAGKSTKPFKYKDKGTMAAIGRNAAVVQMLGGKTMKGHKAQFAWRTVHLALLPTNEDRAKAIVDWVGSEFTHQRVGRITVDADE